MEDRLKELSDKINELSSAIILNHSRLDALRLYCATKIAATENKDRREVLLEIQEVVQRIYSATILSLEDSDPEAPARLDLRGTTPGLSGEDWILPPPVIPSPSEEKG